MSQLSLKSVKIREIDPKDGKGKFLAWSFKEVVMVKVAMKPADDELVWVRWDASDGTVCC